MNLRDCAVGQPATNEIKKGWVVSHQIAKAVSVAAQAPRTVVRRQKSPSQNTIPIIGGIIQKISRPFTTVGSQYAKATPPATTRTETMRPMRM